MTFVAVAGLPGSGKSWLMKEYEREGYSRFDDINMNHGWDKSMSQMKKLLREGGKVIASDILLCKTADRRRLERDIGQLPHWVCFKNEPLQCAKNVLYRAFVEQDRRSWWECMKYIFELSPAYSPVGEIKPVVVTPLP